MSKVTRTESDFEAEAREILENKNFYHFSCGIDADPADGFGKCTCGSEKVLEEVVKKLRHLHQQEMLKLIGEDESLDGQSEYDKEHFGSVKSDAADWVSGVRMATRNSFRAELRTNLSNRKDK